MRRPAAAALAVAAGLAVAGAAVAGSGDDRSRDRRVAAAQGLPGIPAPDRALVQASRRWQRLTRPPQPSLRGLGGAHPGTTTIRVSRRAAELRDAEGRQRFPYPRRTVVLKTGTVDGTLTLVAVMRRVGAGGGAGAWRYVEYTRDGAGERFARVGGGQSLCSDCHALATSRQGSDAVFTRLP